MLITLVKNVDIGLRSVAVAREPTAAVASSAAITTASFTAASAANEYNTGIPFVLDAGRKQQYQYAQNLLGLWHSQPPCS
jgi:hypothetical protein